MVHRQLLEARIAELKSRIATGGLQEAAIRALLYAGMPRGSIDERGIAVLRGIRLMPDGLPRLTLSEFKAMAREQYFMLLLEPEAAIQAIPDLLPPDPPLRRKALDAIQQVLSARGPILGEVADRLEEVARLFGVEPGLPGAAARPAARKADKVKAS